MIKEEVRTLILKAVEAELPLRVLRGLDRRATRFGDIDVVVPCGMPRKACAVATLAAVKEGWYVAGYRDIGYVASIVFVKVTESGELEAVKVDFINGFSWYGVHFTESVANPFSERWGKIHQSWSDGRVNGALTFFQKIMASGFVGIRDWHRILDTGADSYYLETVAKTLDLPISLEEIGARKIGRIKKWRLRAASAGIGNPVSGMKWLFLVVTAHIKFKIGMSTNQGVVIGISGLDGAGKSTLVDKLFDIYHKAGCELPELVHLLPTWIPMPHQIFRRHKTSSNYTKPYSEPPVSSRLSGCLRFTYYTFAFELAKLALLFHKKRGRQIVLDRSFLDFAADPTRSRIPVHQLPRWLIRLLVPTGCLYYLDASPATVVARKGELSLEKAMSLQSAYHDICALTGVTLLNGDDNPDAVFKELLSHISKEYMRRIEAEGQTGK